LAYPGTKYQYSLTWPIFYNDSTTAGEQARYTAFLTSTVIGPGGPGNSTLVGQLYTANISGTGEIVVEKTEPLTTVCE
jgi:hypothetical protein